MCGGEKWYLARIGLGQVSYKGMFSFYLDRWPQHLRCVYSCWSPNPCYHTRQDCSHCQYSSGCQARWGHFPVRKMLKFWHALQFCKRQTLISNRQCFYWYFVSLKSRIHINSWCISTILHWCVNHFLTKKVPASYKWRQLPVIRSNRHRQFPKCCCKRSPLALLSGCCCHHEGEFAS